jgi:hypothetical protein
MGRIILTFVIILGCFILSGGFAAWVCRRAARGWGSGRDGWQGDPSTFGHHGGGHGGHHGSGGGHGGGSGHGGGGGHGGGHHG